MKNQNAKFNLDVCMQFSPLCMGELPAHKGRCMLAVAHKEQS